MRPRNVDAGTLVLLQKTLVPKYKDTPPRAVRLCRRIFKGAEHETCVTLVFTLELLASGRHPGALEALFLAQDNEKMWTLDAIENARSIFEK